LQYCFVSHVIVNNRLRCTVFLTRRRDTPSSSHYIFDAQGNVVGFFGPKFKTTGRHAHIPVRKSDGSAFGQKLQSRFNVHTPRQQLRQLLYQQINIQHIQWGNRSTGF
jgi:hypothetical protein